MALRTFTLTNSLSRRLKRQGKSFARLMPMRGSATTHFIAGPMA
jgi:hypothetical protein